MQQLTVLPQPSECPHPASPKSAHVFGVHVTHVLFEQTWPEPQGAHDFIVPHPRATASHPSATPASARSAHVEGSQQPPSSQISLFGQDVPHVAIWPHAFDTVPHVAAPQVGAEHDWQTLPVPQWVPEGQLPHAMVPLPHALATDPQNAPASPVHSGGLSMHVPPLQIWPAAQEHESVSPQPSVMVPHKWFCPSGAHVSGEHCPASCIPAATHVLPMQAMPALQPPQLTPTPHPSTPMTPQRPVHTFGWQVCAFWSAGLVTHTLPLVQALPQAKTCPLQGSV